MTNSTSKISRDEIEIPRLKPIEHPKSIKLKLIYWFTKRFVGKVVTPLKVHYARFPKYMGLSNKMRSTEKKLTIDPKLNNLIKVYVSTINGCGFCIDIGKAMAQKEKLDPHIFDDLLRFEDSDQFTESEKAALAYVKEATQNKRVEDSTFKRFQQCFSESEIVQITLINAMENFYNLTNVPLNIGSDELCELWSAK
jgi:AhpD family alkylhydroperoxidase